MQAREDAFVPPCPALLGSLDDVRRLEARRSQREQCRKCEKCARWLVFQARRDSLQSSAKRNMALCSSQELRGRKRREGAKRSVHACVHMPVCVYVCGEEGQAKNKDKGFPRALPSPLAKRCKRNDMTWCVNHERNTLTVKLASLQPLGSRIKKYPLYLKCLMDDNRMLHVILHV